MNKNIIWFYTNEEKRSILVLLMFKQKVTVGVLSNTLSNNRSNFIESNNSIGAFDLKIIIQYRSVHLTDRHRTRPTLFHFLICFYDTEIDFRRSVFPKKWIWFLLTPVFVRYIVMSVDHRGWGCGLPQSWLESCVHFILVISLKHEQLVFFARDDCVWTRWSQAGIVYSINFTLERSRVVRVFCNIVLILSRPFRDVNCCFVKKKKKNV